MIGLRLGMFFLCLMCVIRVVLYVNEVRPVLTVCWLNIEN